MRFICQLAFSLIIIITLFQLSVSAKNVFAAGEFSTSYKVSYVTDLNGKTTVNQDVVLTNNTDNYYADKFDLKIGSTKVDEVKAQDNAGPVDSKVDFSNNTTTISLKFNERVIGRAKTLPFKLSYTSNELATKSGQIWEISIPRVANTEQNIDTYDVSVSTPAAFGPIAFAVPTPITTQAVGLNQQFTFNKDQLTNSGISMSFGEKQAFQFKLNYYIENNNITSKTEQISLPPDNNYQKIIVDKIDPPPDNVILDGDGNFLAEYKLSPKEDKDITATGYVEVFSKSARNIDQPLTPIQRDHYTKADKYWETDNAFIRDKANELKTPQKIYDFVTSYLSYNIDRRNQIITDYVNFQKNNTTPTSVGRKGAAQAVQSPKDSICFEFTDLFIAIARAAGIPAREVEGYAYTQNERLRPLSLAIEKDVLHAWPEYWDDSLGWVQVDPTWGSTSGGLDYFNKLDFNHITFVQNGLSSTYPYPPGSFRRSSDADKNLVHVNFTDTLPDFQLNTNLELTAPNKIISGIPVIIKATVTNTGSSSILGESLKLDSNLINTSENPVKIDILPPFAKKEVNYKLETKNYLRSTSETITLNYATKSITKNVSVIPIYYLVSSPTFLTSTIISVIMIVLGHFLYQRLHNRKFKPPQI